MFWGLIMEPRRRYFQEVTRPFHVSMASMDISSCTEDPVQLMVQFQKRNYLLCTLRKGVAIQVPLDLNFESGDEVSFTINGSSHIHLTGYHMEDEYEEIEEAEDEEEEEHEEEHENEGSDLSQSNIVYGKRKQSKATTNLLPVAKRSKTLELLSGDIGSDDDDDSDDEDVTFSDLDNDNDDDDGDTTLDSVNDNVDDSDDDDDGDDVDNDGDDDDVELEDDEDSEEELQKQIVVKQQQQQTKKQKKQQQMAEKPQKQKNKKEQQQQQQQQQQQVNGTPQSEKKKKKNKKQEQNASPAKDLNVSVKEKKQEQAKTPKSDKKQKNQQNSPHKKFVDRGVSIEELSIGTGSPAKAGKFAHMYYEGRLKHNNKMFDSCNKGPPFKFRLGSAEVIKGWDVGVMGMKIGGKRRITVPPQMAYGSKGIPPEIPPNSTLVFDLELKSVN